MSPSESSTSGSTGRRRKPNEADSIEGLAESPSRRSGAKGARRRRARSAQTTRRGMGVRVLVGGVALAVVVAAVVLVMRFMGGTEAPADRRPVSYKVNNAGGNVSETLESREVDSRELNESEVLERGNEEIESQGITFELVSSTFTDACEEVVWGEEVATALADGDCAQAAVGGYTSADHVGIAAIFNLADVASATVVAEAMEPPDSPGEKSPGFITVPGDDGGLDALGTGYSTAQATVSGHYLVVAWAQSKNPPPADERENLSAPVIALGNFRDPLFRRVVQLENANEQADGEDGAGAEGGDGEGDPSSAQPEGGAEPGGGAPEAELPEGDAEAGVPEGQTG